MQTSRVGLAGKGASQQLSLGRPGPLPIKTGTECQVVNSSGAGTLPGSALDVCSYTNPGAHFQ